MLLKKELPKHTNNSINKWLIRKSINNIKSYFRIKSIRSNAKFFRIIKRKLMTITTKNYQTINPQILNSISHNSKRALRIKSLKKDWITMTPSPLKNVFKNLPMIHKKYVWRVVSKSRLLLRNNNWIVLQKDQVVQMEVKDQKNKVIYWLISTKHS